MVLLSPVADEQLDLAVDFERPVSLYLPDRNGCPLSTMGTSMELRLESESNDLYGLMLGLGAERNVPGVDGAFNGSNSRSSCFGSVVISARSFAWPCNELLDMLAKGLGAGCLNLISASSSVSENPSISGPCGSGLEIWVVAVSADLFSTGAAGRFCGLGGVDAMAESTGETDVAHAEVQQL